MLNFFHKKQYLRDLLDGFVDIHCHILPGIDDGAKDVEDSIKLIKELKKMGVSEFIPTPHIMQDLYANDDETIGNSFEILLEAISRTSLKDTPINPSAEYMLDNNFSNLLNTGNVFPLKGKHILIEMSYLQAPINLEEIIFDIKMKGYTPVLAHPERYTFYHNKKENYKNLKDLGCLFQLNLLSLGMYYGKSIKKTSDYLLSQNLVDFVGTDTHHIKHINNLSKITLNKIEKEKVSSIIKNTTNTFSVV